MAMTMCVVMVMFMIMIMIMAVMVVVMVVRVALIVMIMAAAGIGAAFRIERRVDLDHPGAKPLGHVGDDMIVTNAQGFAQNLRRQMPIAEMPGDAHQMMRIVAADLDERLGRGDDLDKPAIVQHQRVAAAQRNCLRQIEQKFKAARAAHRHTAAMTIVEIENDAIGRLFVPTPRRLHAGRSHGSWPRP